MTIVWIIVVIILICLLSDYIWTILLVTGAILAIYFILKAKREHDEAAHRAWIQEKQREQREQQRNASNPYSFGTTGSNAYVTTQNTTITPVQVNPPDSSKELTSKKEALPTPRKTEPTAQNAYIFNIDYIAECKDVFIAFDVETTGLSPYTDRIIELSAVRFENFSPCKTFSTLINPQRSIPPHASSVNHIYDKDVADAPMEAAAIQMFCNFIGEETLNGSIVLVAHNANFDIKFLLYALSRAGIDANLQFQDTLYMSQHASLDLPNHKLQTVAKHFGIAQTDAHRAADDARVCGEIFVRLLQDKNSRHLEKLGTLSPEEKELSLWLKGIIKEADLNTQLLSFDAKSYFRIKCIHEVARFKTKAKKMYALIPKDIDIPAGIEAVVPSKSESEKYLRVYFSTPAELDLLKQYYLDAYRKAFSYAESYIGDSTERMKKVAAQIDVDICV